MARKNSLPEYFFDLIDFDEMETVLKDTVDITEMNHGDEVLACISSKSWDSRFRWSRWALNILDLGQGSRHVWWQLKEHSPSFE